MLAFEPPHFGAGATVGGMVAAGLSGPRRAAAGAVRDFVLGVRMLDGRGDDLSFGGQVMKNVAGYDVSRLMAGSLGTLGLILEVSLKVLPLPFAEATLRLELPAGQGARRCSTTGAASRCRSAPAPGPAASSRCACRARRARSKRRARRSAASRSTADQASGFWRGIREQTDPFFSTDKPLWRLSLPSVAPPLALPGRAADRVGRLAALAREQRRCAHHARGGGAGRRACHAVSRGRQECGRVHAACSRRWRKSTAI